MLCCTEADELTFESLTLDQNNQIEFLGKKNLSLQQLSKSIDSLIKAQGVLNLEVDINGEFGYDRFYKIRKHLQLHRDKLLVSLKHPTGLINYYTIEAEPEITELDRFSSIQTIEINKWKPDHFAVNEDSTILQEDLREALLMESNHLLKEQVDSTDKVLLYWINLSSPTTMAECKYIGEMINQSILTLNHENEDLITRIIELQQARH